MLGPTITVAFSVATLPTFALTVAPGLGGASVAGTLAAAYGAGNLLGSAGLMLWPLRGATSPPLHLWPATGHCPRERRHR
jgi:hypothetical protein